MPAAPESWRLFVAVHPPPRALDEVAAAVDAVRASAPPGLRWTRPDQWHLTVAFLGPVPLDTVPKVQAELAHVAGRHGPASLRIAGAGRFGDRVLWVGICDGESAGGVTSLRNLAGATARRVSRTGLQVEDRFKAHLTLARARERADLRPLVEALRDLAGTPWMATELCLVRSRLGAGPDRGSAYSTIMAWPLE